MNRIKTHITNQCQLLFFSVFLPLLDFPLGPSSGPPVSGPLSFAETFAYGWLVVSTFSNSLVNVPARLHSPDAGASDFCTSASGSTKYVVVSSGGVVSTSLLYTSVECFWVVGENADADVCMVARLVSGRAHRMAAARRYIVCLEQVGCRIYRRVAVTSVTLSQWFLRVCDHAISSRRVASHYNYATRRVSAWCPNILCWVCSLHDHLYTMWCCVIIDIELLQLRRALPTRPSSYSFFGGYG